MPCRRGDARVTKPELIHGSTGTSSIRRTILPWLVGVEQDGRSLDTSESGTWNDLCIAHTRQEAPHSSPSGHPNMYGAIPHRFAPACRLSLETPVSQALVCVRTWDDPAVINEANMLLGQNRRAVHLHISRARMQDLRMYKATFKAQAAAEYQCFGSELFQARRDRGELQIRGAGEGGVGEELPHR